MQEVARQANITAVELLFHYDNGDPIFATEVAQSRAGGTGFGNNNTYLYTSIATAFGQLINVIGGFIASYALVGVIGITYKARFRSNWY